MVEQQISQFKAEVETLEAEIKTGYETLRKKEKRMRILKKASEQLERLNKRLNADDGGDDFEE